MAEEQVVNASPSDVSAELQQAWDEVENEAPEGGLTDIAEKAEKAPEKAPEEAPAKGDAPPPEEPPEKPERAPEKAPEKKDEDPDAEALAEERFAQRKKEEDERRVAAEAERLRKDEEAAAAAKSEKETEVRFTLDDDSLDSLLSDVGETEIKTFSYNDDDELTESDTTIAEFAKKYPDVFQTAATVAKAIAEKAIADAVGPISDSVQSTSMSVQQMQQEQARAAFVTEIEGDEEAGHPDAGDIVYSEGFSEWVGEQSEAVQALGRSTDRADAILLLDIFKRKHPDQFPASGKKPATSAKDTAKEEMRRRERLAATSVDPKSGGSPTTSEPKELQDEWDDYDGE